MCCRPFFRRFLGVLEVEDDGGWWLWRRESGFDLVGGENGSSAAKRVSERFI